MNRPVLILGWIPRIIVPIARSLHRHGVPVDVASFPSTPRIPSRAICESRTVAHPDTERSEFVRQLRQFIRERGHDLLIPADDCMLRAVVENYDDFADLLHIGCPPPAIARLVLDKTATLEIAERCGVRAPRTAVVSQSAELHDLAGSFSFPWILKPAQKETRVEEVKSCKLTSVDEVAKRFPLGRELTPHVLVQEYCAGSGVGVEMLLDHGECLAVFQHRRLKELPYTGGFSVIAVAEAPNPNLVQSSLALLRAMQWQGIAMVEYKMNANGEAVLMEVNGRYWGSIALAISAGIDFPWYEWQVAHGERPEVPTECAVGTKWRWTIGYLHRLYELVDLARGSATAREVLYQDLRQLGEDFGPSVSDPMLKLSDPMPYVVGLLHAMGEFASYTATRVANRYRSLAVRLDAR